MSFESSLLGTRPSTSLKEDLMILVESHGRSMDILKTVLRINETQDKTVQEVIAFAEEKHGELILETWRVIFVFLSLEKDFEKLVNAHHWSLTNHIEALDGPLQDQHARKAYHNTYERSLHDNSPYRNKPEEPLSNKLKETRLNNLKGNVQHLEEGTNNQTFGVEGWPECNLPPPSADNLSQETWKEATMEIRDDEAGERDVSSDGQNLQEFWNGDSSLSSLAPLPAVVQSSQLEQVTEPDTSVTNKEEGLNPVAGQENDVVGETGPHIADDSGAREYRGAIPKRNLYQPSHSTESSENAARNSGGCEILCDSSLRNENQDTGFFSEEGNSHPQMISLFSTLVDTPASGHEIVPARPNTPEGAQPDRKSHPVVIGRRNNRSNQTDQVDGVLENGEERDRAVQHYNAIKYNGVLEEKKQENRWFRFLLARQAGDVASQRSSAAVREENVSDGSGIEPGADERSDPFPHLQESGSEDSSYEEFFDALAPPHLQESDSENSSDEEFFDALAPPHHQESDSENSSDEEFFDALAPPHHQESGSEDSSDEEFFDAPARLLRRMRGHF